MSEQIKIETAEAQVPEAIEEIVFSAPAPAVPAQKFSIEEIVAWADRNADLMRRLINVSIKITNQHDWVDQNGRPYLCHSGAEKIARLFRISWSSLRIQKEWSDDEFGKFYIYTVSGIFSHPQLGSIEAIGACSQRDKFFCFKKNERGELELKPISEIDEVSIKKAAYTNCIVNGITHLLGLRSLTWEQLETAGIKKDQIKKIDYQESPAQNQKAEECWKMALEIAGGNEERAINEIKLASYFKSKSGEDVMTNDVFKVKNEKWLNQIHHRLRIKLDQMIAAKEAKK